MAYNFPNIFRFGIRSLEMKIKIPVDKLYSLKDLIICFLARKKATLKEFQALAGLLNFCLRAIPTARAFTRRIYDVMQGVVINHITLLGFSSG